MLIDPFFSACTKNSIIPIQSNSLFYLARSCNKVRVRGEESWNVLWYNPTALILIGSKFNESVKSRMIMIHINHVRILYP